MNHLMLLLVIGSLILTGCPGRLPDQPAAATSPPAPERPATPAEDPAEATATPHVAGADPGSSMGPTQVSYTGSLGTVSFPHADHATRLDCRLCHPKVPPKKILVDRSFAHTTCTACHLNSGTGPTGCRQCHVKP